MTNLKVILESVQMTLFMRISRHERVDKDNVKLYICINFLNNKKSF